MKPGFSTPTPEFFLLHNLTSDFKVQNQGAGHKGVGRRRELRTRPALGFQDFQTPALAETLLHHALFSELNNPRHSR